MNSRQVRYPLFLMVMTLALLSGAAVEAAPFRAAPLNPDFQNWLDGKSPEAAAAGLGYIPDPVDWSHLQPLGAKDVLPMQFDLRDSGSLTAVRNQLNCGACWAFAACGVMESWLKIHEGETRDFSENHMKNNHGFVMNHCAGGNNAVSTAYLARWIGPLTESDDPYNPNQVVAPAPGAQVQKLLLSAPIFTAQGANRDDIQYGILYHGPLSTMMMWGESYFNSAENTYYYGGTGMPNHMVVLVGWDDAKVVPGAPGPGAWICRNSWGTTWGENGYFYISYYDTIAGREGVGFFDLAAPGAYDRLYQYDELGLTHFFGTPPSQVAHGANVFTALADETLVAVGTYAAANYTAYEIKVYDSGISGDRFFNPVLTVSGEFMHAGYHVVDLPDNVSLTQGQQFAVVIRYQTPGWVYPVPVEAPVPGYAAPTAAVGQSYVSQDGVSFQDLLEADEGYENANVCIKAIVGVREIAPPAPVVRILGRPRVVSGSLVIFSAQTANLTGTVTYAWYKDGVLLDGATASEYVIPEADESHAGAYVLQVTDESKGIFHSAPFVLEVLPEGSMPVAHLLALTLIVGLLAWIGVRGLGRPKLLQKSP